MPRAKKPLRNRRFVGALGPHGRAAGWIWAINNSIPFQRKPEEELERDRHRLSQQAAAAFMLTFQR